MPAGVDVIEPAPVPAGITVRLTSGISVKVAVQFEFAANTICIVEAVPVQLPDQPAKVDPALATTDSVTVVLAAMLAEQTLPQDIPAGVELTVPAPVPALETASVNDAVPGEVAPLSTAEPPPPQAEIAKQKAKAQTIRKIDVFNAAPL